MDETWIHFYTLETKQQSNQWSAKGEPASKTVKRVPSVEIVPVTGFLGYQTSF